MMGGDDLHSTESLRKMQAGIALDDADYWPWLDRIASYLATSTEQDLKMGKVGLLCLEALLPGPDSTSAAKYPFHFSGR